MKQVRKRFTYANVMSSIAVFLVLGGVAAAVSVPHKSVGTKQLKAGAVTAAKLHKNAVTNAKIKNGVVESRKVADGSLEASDLNVEGMPFGRVIARLRTSSSLNLKEELQPFPLTPSSYTQAANEVDSYYGAVDVTFQPTCTPPRNAVALLMVDPTTPTKVEPIESLVGVGGTVDKAGGTVTKRIEISPLSLEIGGSRFEPGSPKAHALSLVVEGECEGATSGITATFGGVDVVGVR
jgi:hypothetical protein